MDPRRGGDGVVYLLAVLTGTALISCTSQPHVDTAHLEWIRTQAAEFSRSYALLEYQAAIAGLPCRTDSLYGAFDSLFSTHSTDNVHLALSVEQDSVQRRRLAVLQEWLLKGIVAHRTAPLMDSLGIVRNNAITLEGREIPYRLLYATIAGEYNDQRRGAWYRAGDSVRRIVDTLLDSIAHVRADLHRQSGPLPVRRDDQELFAAAETLLTRTDTVYAMLVREQAAAAKTRQSAAHTFPVVVRGTEFDQFFRRDMVIPEIRKIYATLGINPDSLPGLHIVAMHDPAITDVCARVNIPNDIRVVIGPTGTAAAFSAALAVAGMGLDAALNREHAVEFACCGDDAVWQSSGELARSLLTNQAWLRMYSGMPPALIKRFARHMACVRLFQARLAAADVLALDAGRTDRDTLVQRATGIAGLAEDETFAPEPWQRPLDARTRFRAILLGAQMTSMCEAEFGINWFENRAAGVFLRSLWARGRRETAQERARLFGYVPGDVEPLVRRLRLFVLFSTP